jgi:mRNA-degrading endonuclease toxin of MazEF toxin-antitoxin module
VSFNDDVEKEFNEKFLSFKQKIFPFNLSKCKEIFSWIITQIELDSQSKRFYRLKLENPDKSHPIRPKRGEVYTINYGANVGFEFSSPHLGLIIQNDTGNRYRNLTIVIPITEFKDGKFDKYINKKITNEDFESKEINGLDKDPSKLKFDDMRAIDKARIGVRVGKVKSIYMRDVEKQLKEVLGLG